MEMKPDRVLRGIGDDAAVVYARPVCVTSVDALVEGVHFRLHED
jgi:thiamine-monophosphate kinase